jgi:Arc/MetJ-type ribon-helix-helix transcriptional regulator
MADRKKSNRQNMRLVSIHLPPVVVDLIDVLVERGIYTNRSSAIRAIVTLYAPKVLRDYDFVEEFIGVVSKNAERPVPDPNSGDGIEKILSFRVTPKQGRVLVAMAEYYSNGNMSELVRTALDHLYREHFVTVIRMMQKE